MATLNCIGLPTRAGLGCALPLRRASARRAIATLLAPPTAPGPRASRTTATPALAAHSSEQRHAAAAPAAALLSGAAAWLASSAPSVAAEEAAANSITWTAAGLDLLVYLAKTLIAWGVPGGVALVLVLVATARTSKGKGAQAAGGDDDDRTPAFLKQLSGKNSGDKDAPVEYLKVVPLNDRLDSYSYSLAKATGSKAKATADNRRRTYAKKFTDLLGELEDGAITKVLEAEKTWAKEAATAQATVDALTRELRAMAVQSTMKEDGKQGGGMGAMFDGEANKVKDKQKALGAAVAARAAVDDKYLRAVGKEVNAEQRKALAELVAQRAALGWQDGENPMALAPVSDAGHSADKNVFVLKFNGDVQASQVKGLREEVTAIVQSEESQPGDEVVLILNTGGGTVTGYGLAAAQLTRLKEAGLKLTVCVEQVAASGGYMMACCADRLVASPFAVLGSIGVISEQPNVYDRLKREGIEFQTVTAGKFKRTLTPFKKPTEEDFNKNKEDIEKVLVLFKSFVASQRPGLVIDEVATGETWFGADALARGLCDELKTTDDVLLELRRAGARLFELRFQPERTNPLAALVGSGASLGAGPAGASLLGRLLSPATSVIAAAVAQQLAAGALPPLQQGGSRARLEDSEADSLRASDGEDAPNDLWWM